MRLLFPLLILTMLMASAPTSVAQSPQASAVTIGRRDSLWSPTLREWGRFQVYTPPGYASSTMLPRAYPVLYVLDGPVHFHPLTGLVRFLTTDAISNFVLPEMIVVAIASTDRTRDLTPTHSTTAPWSDSAQTAFRTSGGGESFLKFVRTELIPHIDSTYRVEPFRVLVGHSFGGITAINALYTMPEVFNAYVAIDPSLWWDDRTLVRRADRYFASARLVNRTLFVAQANTVDLTANAAAGPCASPRHAECPDSGATAHFRAISDFYKVLQSSAASGLRYGFRYYPDDDHSSLALLAEHDALRFIFEGYRLEVSLAKKPGPTAIARHFADVSRRLGYSVLPPEKLLSSMGSEAEFDAAWALSVARYYAQLYPRSPRAFDVLGGALLAVHDTTAARAAYEQSIILNPESQRIRDLLAKLRR